MTRAKRCPRLLGTIYLGLLFLAQEGTRVFAQEHIADSQQLKRVQRQLGNDNYNRYYNRGDSTDIDSDKIIFQNDDSADSNGEGPWQPGSRYPNNGDPRSNQGPAEALKAPTAKRTAADGGDGRCGVTIPVLRILNGNEARQGQFPWQANIIEKKAGTVQHKCGGVLVHPRIVLTVAHCVDPNEIEANHIEVRLGAISRIAVDKDSLTFAPDRIIVHPNYHKGVDMVTNVQSENDIALIRLQQAAPYTDYIRPICLPDIQRTSAGNYYIPPSTLVAAGWGITETGSNKEKLTFAPVPLADTSMCSALHRFTIAASQFCAGGNGTDPCQGDSGNPLIQGHADAQGEMVYDLVGLVSWGIECGIVWVPDGTVPVVYTRVMAYRIWLGQTIYRQVN